MEMSATDMVAVPIEAFVKGLPIRVDTYLALSSEKYVMLFKAGSPVDLERIEGYRERSLKHLYVRHNDFRPFFEGQFAMTRQALQHPRLPGEHRVQFLNIAHQVLLTQLENLSFSAEAYAIGKEIGRSVVACVTTEPALIKLLHKLEANAQGTLNHSMAVAMVSTMIGRALGWVRPETLEKLALGGIFHDVGLIELALQLRVKPRSEMTSLEIKEYESHVERGVRLLQSVAAVPSDIIAIAQDHHETALGEGYPRRLRDLKINPLAKVVALADTFCDLILPTDGTTALSPAEAIQHIESALGQPYNKDTFKKLKALVFDGKV